MKNLKSSRGFTLIEMLIVITIIAVLAAMILVGMGGARVKTRDAKRIGELHNMMPSLEMYAQSNSGLYPIGSYDDVTRWQEFSDVLINGGIGVTRVSKDPLNNDTYHYRYSSTDGITYVLGAFLEQKNAALDEDVNGTDVEGLNCDDGTAAPFHYCITP